MISLIKRKRKGISGMSSLVKNGPSKSTNAWRKSKSASASRSKPPVNCAAKKCQANLARETRRMMRKTTLMMRTLWVEPSLF